MSIEQRITSVQFRRYVGMNQNLSSVLAQVSSNFTYVPALDGRMRFDKLFSQVHASLHADQRFPTGSLGQIFFSPT